MKMTKTLVLSSLVASLTILSSTGCGRSNEWSESARATYINGCSDTARLLGTSNAGEKCQCELKELQKRFSYDEYLTSSLQEVIQVSNECYERTRYF